MVHWCITTNSLALFEKQYRINLDVHINEELVTENSWGFSEKLHL